MICNKCQSEVTGKYCSNCGAEVINGTNFVDNLNKYDHFTDENTNARKEFKQSGFAPKTKKNINTAYCPDCGNILNKAKFCNQCGFNATYDEFNSNNQYEQNTQNTQNNQSYSKNPYNSTKPYSNQPNQPNQPFQADPRYNFNNQNQNRYRANQQPQSSSNKGIIIALCVAVVFVVLAVVVLPVVLFFNLVADNVDIITNNLDNHEYNEYDDYNNQWEDDLENWFGGNFGNFGNGNNGNNGGSFGNGNNGNNIPDVDSDDLVWDSNDTDEINPAGISKAEYEKLKVGMTYNEVSGIIGGDAIISQSDDKTFIANWILENNDDGYISILFENGKIKEISSILPTT